MQSIHKQIPSAFFLLLVGLGFELRASRLQNRQNDLIPSSRPFCWGYFVDGLLLLDCISKLFAQRMVGDKAGLS
jgi:hypothetical protein